MHSKLMKDISMNEYYTKNASQMDHYSSRKESNSLLTPQNGSPRNSSKNVAQGKEPLSIRKKLVKVTQKSNFQ